MYENFLCVHVNVREDFFFHYLKFSNVQFMRRTEGYGCMCARTRCDAFLLISTLACGFFF